MKTHVEFKSSSFPKYDNEDEELINPNRWGKRLAEFIRDYLPEYGVKTEDILCEDWGWLIHIQNEEFPLWIGCGPMDDVNEEGDLVDQPTNGEITYCAFIIAKPSFLKKLFKKVNTEGVLSDVSLAMERMLAERSEFSDVQWE